MDLHTARGPGEDHHGPMTTHKQIQKALPDNQTAKFNHYSRTDRRETSNCRSWQASATARSLDDGGDRLYRKRGDGVSAASHSLSSPPVWSIRCVIISCLPIVLCSSVKPRCQMLPKAWTLNIEAGAKHGTYGLLCCNIPSKTTCFFT
ncbi:hypothetical protein UPYG_G00260980 [Umbra pygmaea]|uniref:Uncharacterized protein n=1 Tax=Umbra pygmaea TaxID=75934 RepID=A0ABD0WZA7_UMBPY